MKFVFRLFLSALAVCLGGCPDPDGPGAAPVYAYSVVGEFPHDAEAFTQGLVFDGGRLFEDGKPDPNQKAAAERTSSASERGSFQRSFFLDIRRSSE